MLSFSQPTNQPAGCPLDGATLTLFAGSGTDAGLTDAGLTCEWSDASTLVAYYTSASTLKPGSIISLAPATVWPAGWSGSCVASPGMCSSAAEPVVLPTDAPCDDTSTTRIVEACLMPAARISGPTSLSLCPGSALTLTGAYATANDTSGARRATQYRWGVAEGTANPDAISAHLATQSTESVQLSAKLLDGGAARRKCRLGGATAHDPGLCGAGSPGAWLRLIPGMSRLSRSGPSGRLWRGHRPLKPAHTALRRPPKP